MVLLVVGALTPPWPKRSYALFTAAVALAAGVLGGFLWHRIDDKGATTLIGDAIHLDQVGVWISITICIGVFLVALLGFRFASRTVPGAGRVGGPVLAGAVVFYACVIAAMVITAWATTAWVAAAGAMLFAVSDWVLGHQRFVGPLPGGRLTVMVPYHVGQALLIVGLATAS